MYLPVVWQAPYSDVSCHRQDHAERGGVQAPVAALVDAERPLVGERLATAVALHGEKVSH